MCGEIAHHRDGNKKNNSPENIEVLSSQSEHARIHFIGTKQSQDHIRKRVESRALTIREKHQFP